MAIEAITLDRGKANLDFDILQLYVYLKTDRDINVQIRQQIVALIVRFVAAGILSQRPGHRLLTSTAF